MHRSNCEALIDRRENRNRQASNFFSQHSPFVSEISLQNIEKSRQQHQNDCATCRRKISHQFIMNPKERVNWFGITDYDKRINGMREIADAKAATQEDGKQIAKYVKWYVIPCCVLTVCSFEKNDTASRAFDKILNSFWFIWSSTLIPHRPLAPLLFFC